MKILSVNVDLTRRFNKFRPGFPRYESFRHWILAESPEIVLFQEACSYREGICGPLLLIEGYVPITDSEDHERQNTSRVGSFARTKNNCRFVRQHCPRWQEFQVGDLTIHNVYFPSDSSKDAPKREKFLRELTARIVKSGGRVVVAGDFNLAPTLLDCKNPHSDYVRARTLQAVQDLQNEAGLFDALEPPMGNRPLYTHESNAFRCDLAFVSIALKGRIQARYEHRTRTCKREGPKVPPNPSIAIPFTDHSGIILCVDI